MPVPARLTRVQGLLTIIVLVTVTVLPEASLALAVMV
jgi:hypothetical protein